MIKAANSLANNSLLRNKKVANPFLDIKNFKIRELELSITNKCNLTCRGCGFNVPNQLNPVSGVGIKEHITALRHLKNIGFKVEKIVLVGGEVALSKYLSSYIEQIKSIEISDQIEIVTNGLHPQGITKEVLLNIDSFVISDYVGTDKFEKTWRQYLMVLGYKGEIDFRRKTAWDDLLTEVNNEASKTQEHWSSCFYRTYDVTLERGRIFSCSRIAKKNWDEQGLVINSNTSIESLVEYLTASHPQKACYSCATVDTASQLPVAEQTRSNINKIISKAEQYMDGKF